MNNYGDKCMLSDALILVKVRHVSRVFRKRDKKKGAFFPLSDGFKTGRFHNFVN